MLTVPFSVLHISIYLIKFVGSEDVGVWWGVLMRTFDLDQFKFDHSVLDQIEFDHSHFD